MSTPVLSVVKSGVRRVVPRRMRVRIGIARQDFVSAPPIIVYQMGKVGSQTVVHSLLSAGIANPVYHVHHLRRETIDAAWKKRLGRGLSPNSRDFHDLHLGEALSRRMARPDDEPWFVVTGIRDPIARAVSAMFFSATYLYPEAIVDGEIRSDRILDLIRQDFENDTHYLTDVLTWFDDEFRPATGLNVFDFEFDRKAGFGEIVSGNYRVFVYRLEDLNETLSSRTFSNFFDLAAPVKIVHRNSATIRSYSEAYREVNSKLRLPRAKCEAIYRHDTIRHFYDEEMIARFIRRWSR